MAFVTFYAHEINRPAKYQYHLFTETTNNKGMLILSGIYLIRIKSTWEPRDFPNIDTTGFKSGTSTKWAENRICIYLYVPKFLPSDKQMNIEHVVPFVTINSIYNPGHAVNTGWSVEYFLPGEGSTKRVCNDLFVPLVFKAKVRDGYLMRVSYSLTFAGPIVSLEP